MSGTLNIFFFSYTFIKSLIKADRNKKCSKPGSFSSEKREGKEMHLNYLWAGPNLGPASVNLISASGKILTATRLIQGST